MSLDSQTYTSESSPSESAPAAQPAGKSGATHAKKKRGGVTGVLRKVWLPVVILLVVAVAGFAVYRLHGVFGKTELTRPGSGLANDTKPFNPKTVVYEIDGPPGTVATINYLDLDATPQIARDVTLPWSITLTTTAPAASANIVAQGDSDTISCRITVNGELKDQKTSTGVNAQTFCLVKSA
ncbi:membrane protein [Mycolicibacterium anyangense]|uniref:Membrane protein n=1 Tax=Mycolicibacterium anyangense TaxID=1431246 RepID=A0A6N4W4L4_9MYCO|nr:membrane protein [Mycolicibacterium anyangense]